LFFIVIILIIVSTLSVRLTVSSGAGVIMEVTLIVL